KQGRPFYDSRLRLGSLNHARGASLNTPCGLHRIERLMRSQALKPRPRRRRLRPQATAPILDSTRLCKKAWYRHCRRTSLAFARLNAIFLESVLLTALALS